MNIRSYLFEKISILSCSSHLRGGRLRDHLAGGTSRGAHSPVPRWVRGTAPTAQVSLGRILNLWLPVILWCSLLFYLSSIPNLKTAENPFWDEIIRNGAHLVFYTILYLLFFRALNFQRKEKLFGWPLVLSFLYGLSDEIHQSFVPTRTFQIRDLLINFLGALAGGLGLLIWAKFDKESP